MLFFPTGDPSTWVSDPLKTSKSAPTPTPWVTGPSTPEPSGSGRYQAALTDLWKPRRSAPTAPQTTPTTNPPQ
ncbi:hypothetical protein J132_04145 [Termitomyces sp. J132]|nr:hypothetical protein J132_04145 [Termitomyces sp. J132]